MLRLALLLVPMLFCCGCQVNININVHPPSVVEVPSVVMNAPIDASMSVLFSDATGASHIGSGPVFATETMK